uniref:BPTI/Kunitz inhibitor domain-containing protein n=1 Tax=Romanomermis culicivorax TaxID=13658 RepID=A0A915J9W1_ROMCU
MCIEIFYKKNNMPRVETKGALHQQTLPKKPTLKVQQCFLDFCQQLVSVGSGQIPAVESEVTESSVKISSPTFSSIIADTISVGKISGMQGDSWKAKIRRTGSASRKTETSKEEPVLFSTEFPFVDLEPEISSIGSSENSKAVDFNVKSQILPKKFSSESSSFSIDDPSSRTIDSKRSDQSTQSKLIHANTISQEELFNVTQSFFNRLPSQENITPHPSIHTSLPTTETDPPKLDINDFLKKSKFPVPDDFRVLLAKMALISMPIVSESKKSKNDSTRSAVISIDDSLDDYSTAIVNNDFFDTKINETIIASTESTSKNFSTDGEQDKNSPIISIENQNQKHLIEQLAELENERKILRKNITKNERNSDAGHGPKNFIEKMFDERKKQLESQMEEIEKQKIELLDQLASIRKENCNKTVDTVDEEPMFLSNNDATVDIFSNQTEAETTGPPIVATTDSVGLECKAATVTVDDAANNLIEWYARVESQYKWSQGGLEWYEENQTECGSYSYAYCGADLELKENPIKFPEECYELCYSQSERQRLNLKLLKYTKLEKGLRSTLEDQSH